MKRASYKDAIAWIAENEQGDGNPDQWLSMLAIEESPTVAFCAAIYNRTEEEVAAEVLLVRTKRKAADLRAARATDKEAAQ